MADTITITYAGSENVIQLGKDLDGIGDVSIEDAGQSHESETDDENAEVNTPLRVESGVYIINAISASELELTPTTPESTIIHETHAMLKRLLSSHSAIAYDNHDDTDVPKPKDIQSNEASPLSAGTQPTKDGSNFSFFIP